MKRWFSIGCVLAAVVASGCGFPSQRMLARAIPKFPELPAPVGDLREGQSGLVYFRTSTPFDLDVLLTAPESALETTGVGTLFLPEDTASPVPAMILLHGSGGITPGREMQYGQMLAENGIAAFVIDYYLPRGVTHETPYMLRVLSVTEFDVISDAYAALELLSTHPAIDPNRIGVAGYSYGGMATRFAMDERLHRILAPDHPGFALYVDFYGPCFQRLGTRATNGGPLLTLRGTEDKSNDLAACAEREAELRDIGVSVEAHVFEGVGHAWEANIPRKLNSDAPYVQGCEMVYDEQGHSSVNGQPVVDVPVETSRVDRILIRVSSGDVMQDCVKSGYVIGRDDAAKAQSDTLFLAFLERGFGRTRGAARH